MMSPINPAPAPSRRDPIAMLATTLAQWGEQGDLWLFGYASLIWRPDFPFTERRSARVLGWHRALKMWSRINRGTPECPGLVFALLAGGSCHGLAFRVKQAQVPATLALLWEREMPSAVYDPRFLRCNTPQGDVTALTFTLSRKSPSFTGTLSPKQYHQIFSAARGRYGTTLDYAQQTYDSLLQHGIHDKKLEALLISCEKSLK